MKKILIALPVILFLILSVCFPVASAAEEEDYGYRSLEYFQTKIDDYEDDYNGTDYYLYLQARQSPDTKNTYSQYCVWSPDKADIIDGDGVLTINFKSTHYYYVTMGLSFGFSSIDSISIDRIVIDSNNNVISFYNDDSQRFPFDDIYLVDYETNFESTFYTPDVYVEFNPDLSGTVSRDISINGNAGKLSSISMYIENRSNFNIQYKVEIYKANQSNSRWDYESPDNYSRDNLSASFDDDPVFVYFSNQQVYSHIKTDNNLPGFGYHSPTSLYTKASYFHKLDKGQSETVSFPLSMINLSEDVDYRVKVTAYKLDYQYVTEATFPLDPDNVDKSNFEYDSSTALVAYDSVFRFSDLSGVKYNPDQTSGNILPYDGSNGISDQKKYHVNYDAVTDLETGETKIGHVDNFNSDDYWDSIGVPFQSKYNTFTESFDSSLDLSSFSSLFSPVFGAVGMFFNFLPPSVSMIFIFGFTCLIVIAIIKAVKS